MVTAIFGEGITWYIIFWYRAGSQYRDDSVGSYILIGWIIYIYIAVKKNSENNSKNYEMNLYISTSAQENILLFFL